MVRLVAANHGSTVQFRLVPLRTCISVVEGLVHTEKVAGSIPARSTMKVTLVTCRCFRKKALHLKAALVGFQVEVVTNGRWRNFTVKIEDSSRSEVRNWGKHVPSPNQVLQFIQGE